MPRFFWAIVAISLTTISMTKSAQADEGKNYIAPTVSFGLETTSGVNSKFVVADHVSIRPFLEFGSSDRFLKSGIAFGSSITYDFADSKNSAVQPFIGVGYEYNSTQTRTLEAATPSFVSRAFEQKPSHNLFVEAGSDFNVSPSISVNTRLRVPLEDTGRDPTFSIGAGFRF
jgi:Opacity family porin protein